MEQSVCKETVAQVGASFQWALKTRIWPTSTSGSYFSKKQNLTKSDNSA
jgi:hypothetical protein